MLHGQCGPEGWQDPCTPQLSDASILTLRVGRRGVHLGALAAGAPAEAMTWIGLALRGDPPMRAPARGGAQAAFRRLTQPSGVFFDLGVTQTSACRRDPFPR